MTRAIKRNTIIRTTTMLSNPPLQLRSALSTLKISASPLRPCCIAASGKSLRPHFPPSPNRNIFSASKTRPSTLATIKPTSHQILLLRSVSNSATTPSSESTTPTTPSPPSSSSTLNWNEYLQLRRKQRHWNLVASVVTSICTTAAGISIINQQNLETLSSSIFGLDPFIVLGLATAGSGAIGWLLAPTIGTVIFSFVHRKTIPQMIAKDKDLHRRIKKYRVDPSSQSYSNPVPDYYGEKIGSVSDFRNWLKDQRAYNKKRQNFL